MSEPEEPIKDNPGISTRLGRVEDRMGRLEKLMIVIIVMAFPNMIQFLVFI
jgi:hypothetical protein